jgi:hypothetical protein
MAPAKQHAPATLRNREAIREVLARALPPSPRVLEIASGSGEHAVFFAAALPESAWMPSDVDATALASIEAYRAEANLPNLEAPLRVDVMADAWEALWKGRGVNAVVCINMIHIAPYAALVGLLRGAGALLPPGGKLVMYGPYLEDDVPTAPSNEAFDRSLRARDPRWGLRRREDVVARAEAASLLLRERVAMPANNLTLVFERTT